MICYLVTAGSSYTVEGYLATWGRELAPRFQVLPYEQLASRTSFPRATYIFSDLERLSPSQIQLARRLWESLSRAGAGVRLLNDPGRAMRRYDLNQTFRRRSEGSFAAHRVADRVAPSSYPVFLREENAHTILTPLLHSETELEQALVRAFCRRRRVDDLLMVEFRDTSDEDGIYRKYAAFNIGGRIVPCHLVLSDDWVVKRSDGLMTDARLREEMDYVRSNPHRDWLAESFRLAGIDYGRADYSFVDDEPQLWEINTNPMLMHPPEAYHPVELHAQELFAVRVRAALESIDDSSEGSVTVAIETLPTESPPAPSPARRALSKLRALAKGPVRAAVVAAEPLLVRFHRPVSRLVLRLAARRATAP